ncbi:MAG TPA: ABC transporter permease [Tepidisphaeraceae bacterium]|jgi:putative ABC transport system permease protein|nr:ABC transporter permease [Tepidisphaeraceae bacterium]
MGVPVTYNLRNLVERKGTTLMTALGIALTVAVLVTAIALTAGLNNVFAASGDERQALVLRKGVDAELSSTVSGEAYQIIRRLPGIATDANGEPMVSPEGLAVVNLPSVDSPAGMNVSVRGLLPIGLAMRTVNIVEGKMFEPGLRQVVVGESIASRYPDARLGKQVRFGRGTWEVVGVFSAGGSAANSEIWTDLNQLRGDFEQQGGSSSLLVRVDSAAAIATLKPIIDDDQRLRVQLMPEKEYYQRMTQSGMPLQALGFSVAVIMAIGSAFAATNTMYAAVARRSREIGTLRALGFGRWAILRSFMLESICLSLVGGALGVLMALPVNGFTTGIGNFQTFSEVAFKFEVGPSAILWGMVFAALIGALGGFLPAWAASRKNVIAAMREP